MENSIKLQGRVRAERRARRVEQEQEEFKEKLMRMAASQMELEGMAVFTARIQAEMVSSFT